MPDLDCDICSEASSAQNCLPNKSTCSIHSHVLPLNLDISLAQESPIPIKSNRNTLNFQEISARCTSHFVPPCLRSFDENSCSNNANHCNGYCFTSTGLPIGRIHVGVSPNTGHLRIAWANPDAQVKIMSCSFKPSTNSGDFSFCTLPKGTSTSIGNYPESLSYKPPLITHNYCSTCYSWPDENELCQEEHNSSIISSLNSSKCIFSQDSLNVYLVSDASAWPDNHSNLLPDGAERIYHNCSGEKYSHDIHSPQLYVKSRMLPDTWVPSLLSRRSCFFSCILLTYLAMLQDIRASYLHWILLNSMLHEKKCTYNSSSPVLVPFFLPDEPDLLLVYYIKSSLDSNLYETSEECNAVNLIEIIDVTTGYRIPIPSKDQSPSGHIHSTGFSPSVLKKLTSCCPQNYKISSSHYRKRLIHELNNCLMAGRLESLKLLVDPQGGYSVYW
ncbi:hypothetical protein Smp_153860.1 [Schistosoma mansoni]|uniref:hypothetical protein n=1 Tax=Schistosoma mansoni TaxID=6183 RepID=UPI00022DC232|nr:hypothetical protein Smp_153860.1 [Schistosoma mansoni]|eukprot:XP_018652032.1 hypothetical protein Smp_153860.1 [Schistosoma mansoni]